MVGFRPDVNKVCSPFLNGHPLTLMKSFENDLNVSGILYVKPTSEPRGEENM